MGLEKIEVCNKCSGTGETESWGLGHNPDKEIQRCTKCNGTGRVITTTYSFSVPFGSDKKKLYETDNKIIEAIREIEL